MLHTRYSARANNQTATKTKIPFKAKPGHRFFNSQSNPLVPNRHTHCTHGFGYCNRTSSLAFESFTTAGQQLLVRIKSAVTASEIVEALVSYSRTRTTVYFSKGVYKTRRP